MADFLKIGKLIENLTGFIKVKIELLKLDILEEISKGIANLFSLMILMILGLFVLAFASLTLAIFINNYLETPYMGYLIITGFYAVILLVFILLAKSGKLAVLIEDQLINKSKEILEESRAEDE